MRRNHNLEVVKHNIPDSLLAPAVNIVRADEETDMNRRESCREGSMLLLA